MNKEENKPKKEVRMSGNHVIGNIVKEYYDGNTKIIICDDYYRDKKLTGAKKTIEIDPVTGSCKVTY